MKVIMFDGVCNLCNCFVNWIIDRDKKDVFKFSALQTDWATTRLNQLNYKGPALSTVVFDNNGKLFFRSTAVIEILKELGGVYYFFVVFLILPENLRDALYHVIAQNRYKWFGKKYTCRMPTPELKNKFLL